MSAPRLIEGEVTAGGRRAAIVASRFNDFVVASLLEGATQTWLQHGGRGEDLLIARVPGAFELPGLARRLALSGRHDAVVALGCVIRGGTAHFEYVAGECARGLQAVSLETGIPVIFGVLACETVSQAVERAATTAGNKGGEAMAAALEMADLMARLSA